jgi:hypothetical protein
VGRYVKRIDRIRSPGDKLKEVPRQRIFQTGKPVCDICKDKFILRMTEIFCSERCDHRCLLLTSRGRFLPIFGETIGVFLKNQCYDQLFQKIAVVCAENAKFFAKNFGEIIF